MTGRDPGVELPGGYFLPGWACARLLADPALGLAAHGRRIRGRDPALYSVLVGLGHAALHHRDRTTGAGQNQAPITDSATHSPDMITVAQAADQLRCSTRTVTRLINTGQLPGQRPGNGWGWLINSADVARLARRSA